MAARTNDPSVSARQRLRRIGLQILGRNLKQRGYMAPTAANASGDDLTRLLQASAEQIIEKLEEKIELKPSDDAPLERVRRIRAAIHQIRIDDERQLDHRVAATWAAEAILAVSILSYSGDYLAESPTLDRHCETLEKLREDLAEKILHPIANRGVVVQFGEPINLAEHLNAKNSRQALSDLTSMFERSVQRGLDEINASVQTPGGESFELP